MLIGRLLLLGRGTVVSINVHKIMTFSHPLYTAVEKRERRCHFITLCSPKRLKMSLEIMHLSSALTAASLKGADTVANEKQTISLER